LKNPARLLIAGICLITLACGNTVLPHLLDTIPVGIQPRAVSVDPATHTVYTLDLGIPTGAVSVIDGTTKAVIGTVAVGGLPAALVIDPLTHRIYVANQGDRTVSVIDGLTRAVIATVAWPSSFINPGPVALGVDSGLQRIYALDDLNVLSVIDERTNQITDTVKVGQSQANFGGAIAVDPSTHAVYVVSQDVDPDTSALSVVDGAAVQFISTQALPGLAPTSIAIDPQTHTLYVPRQSDGTLLVIDGATTSLQATLPLGQHPQGGTLDTTPQTLDSTAHNIYPQGVALDTTTHTIYVVDQKSDVLSLIDEPTNRLIAAVGLAAASVGVAVDPTTDRVYVTQSQFKGTVSVFSGRQ
jgi:YVTN family beta-propeller protein